MSEAPDQSTGTAQVPSGVCLSAVTAARLEFAIIGLGIFALLLIFQPFSLALFGVGCALVVLAGLINNLLPLCQPGRTLGSLLKAGLIIALIFCVVMLVSIAAAYLYGVFFVIATAPDTSLPFYQQSFVWGVAALTGVLAAVIVLMNLKKHSDG